MSIKQIRLSAQAREQLIRLKTRTGITQWNILCRWAFCLTLQQATPPTPIEIPADSNVEMEWQVFGGETHELYMALLKEALRRGWAGHFGGSAGATVSTSPAPRHRLSRHAAHDRLDQRLGETCHAHGLSERPQYPVLKVSTIAKAR